MNVVVVLVRVDERRREEKRREEKRRSLTQLFVVELILANQSIVVARLESLPSIHRDQSNEDRSLLTACEPK
jgi:hypothetical protein